METDEYTCPLEALAQRFPELISKESLAISDCPPGWERIVVALTEEIDSYTHHTTRSRLKRELIPQIRAAMNRAWYPIYHKLIRFSSGRDVSKLRKMVYRATMKVGKLFSMAGCYERFSPPRVRVAQIKEKFGTLCYYIDGGDDDVQGMIRFAEKLTSITCQYSGQPGTLCVKNGWYATLSKENAEKHNYKIIEKRQ